MQQPQKPPYATSTNKIEPIVIKKYANRRLYNTNTSAYVTLDDVCNMIKKGDEVIIFDAKNGDDITHSVFTQIIAEQENKGHAMMPTGFLRQFISFYGDNMQSVLPRYLEYTMQAFTKNQAQIQAYFRSALGNISGGITGLDSTPLAGGMLALAPFEQMSKQNLALFEQAMRLFAPFTPAAEKPAPESSPATAPPAQPTQNTQTPAPPEPAAALEPLAEEAAIRQMYERLDALQKQIAGLHKKDLADDAAIPIAEKA